MKLAVRALTFSLLVATPIAMAIVAPKKADLAFLAMNASCEKKASGKLGNAHGYGKNKCPCVGIDNLRGYFASTLDFHHVQYPLDLGASCNNWEMGVHPECKGDPMPGWCRESWCYVDPCQCDLDVLPKRTRLGVTFQGNAAYYSYDTCHAFDFWTEAKDPNACIFQKDSTTCSQQSDCAWDGKQCRGKEAVQSCANTQANSATTYGSQDCRCVGFGGHTNGQAVRHINDHQEVVYNSNVGSSCGAWEMDSHPECKTEGPKPGWCSQKWCFVDPCKCNLAKPPSAVMSANSYERYQGKTAFFSYETCGSTDLWTDTLKTEYCHTYTTEATCESKDKCMWTGGKCTPTALGKICSEQKASGILGIEAGGTDENGALEFRPVACLFLAFGMLVG